FIDLASPSRTILISLRLSSGVLPSLTMLMSIMSANGSGLIVCWGLRLLLLSVCFPFHELMRKLISDFTVVLRVSCLGTVASGDSLSFTILRTLEAGPQRTFFLLGG